VTAAVLTCDIGASRVKLAVIDAGGATLAAAGAPSDTPLGADGRSEVDPDLWWQAFTALADEIARAEPAAFARVRAVAVTGMTRTQVFLDHGGAPLGTAITWRDSSAGDAARRIAGQAGEPVDAYHPAARLAAVEAADPDRLGAVACVLDPKDFVASRLTGRAASDPVSLARLVAVTGPGRLDRFRRLLPALLAPGSTIGHVRAGLPGALGHLAGVPVAMASHDTWTAVLGMGALEPGRGYVIAGTSEVTGLMSGHRADADGLLAVEWGEGLWQLGGPSLNGADVIPWLLRLTGRGDAADPGAALDTLLEGPFATRPVLFLPHLSGERVPHWDANLRGAFLGLDRAHGPSDLARAVLEGAALASGDIFARAEAATGAPARDIRIAGGGARSAAWNRIRADVYQRPLVVVAGEPGLTGCAAIAFAALGRFASPMAAAPALARDHVTIAPRPQEAARAARLACLHAEALAATRGLSHALAAFPPPAIID